MNTKIVGFIALFIFCFYASLRARGAQSVDLLKRYPTTLTKGDTARVRPWEFSKSDVYRVSRFAFAVEDKLRVEIGAADVGIGHCLDGAVWAVVIPRDSGTLKSAASANEENIAHVWLRFHPREINRLFPPDAVFSDGMSALSAQMRVIAGTKMTSSW